MVENKTIFLPIKNKKYSLSESIAYQIIDFIKTQQIEFGSQLPSIIELSDLLGVSKSSIRESIKLLNAWGVVTVKHGIGTFVSGTADDRLMVQFWISAEQNKKTLLHLHQIREALEPYIAGLAALNAKPQDIQKFEKTSQRMDQIRNDVIRFLPIDEEFHADLAEATGNPLFSVMLSPIIQLINEVKWNTLKSQGSANAAFDEHQRVIQQVKEGSAEGARLAMQSLLDITWQVTPLVSFTENDYFKTLAAKHPALSDQVAHQILRLIISKELKPGDRLPSLDDLCDSLGVSRTSVREGLKLLNAWGVIEIKRGTGTFVTDSVVNVLHVPLKISAERGEQMVLKLHQVREALEPNIAEIAAREASKEHLKEIKFALDRMTDTPENSEDFIHYDLEFHSSIAEATGNKLFLIIIYPIIDLLQDTLKLAVKPSGARERAQRYHHEIFAQIKARNPEGARKVMQEHLNQSWNEIQVGIDKELIVI